jgi:chromosome segregation ATPase
MERRVLDMHFKGVPRDTIADELGISSGTVSEILSMLPITLEPLRNLSVEMRKNNMIVPDTSQGITLLNDLKKLGVKPDQLSSSIQAVTKTSTEAGYKPETVLQAATKIIELETQSGKHYPEAIQDFEMMNAKTRKKQQQNKKLEERTSQLQDEIKGNEERLEQTYKAANEAPEEIRRFRELRTELNQRNVNLSNVETRRKLLDNIEENGGDAKRIVTLVKEVGSLKRAHASLKREIEKMTNDLKNLQAQKEGIEQMLAQEYLQETELAKEIQSRTDAVDYLNNQNSIINAQTRNLWDNYEKINDLRKEVIAQAGRMLRMNDNEIFVHQMNAQFDIVFQSLAR